MMILRAIFNHVITPQQINELQQQLAATTRSPASPEKEAESVEKRREDDAPIESSQKANELTEDPEKQHTGRASRRPSP
jgi:hypothetical protein